MQARFGVLILAALLSAPAARAGGWTLPLFTAPPGQVLQEAAKSEFKGADVMVLDINSSVRFTADGRAHIEKRTVTLVLTAEGVKKAATFSQAWSPWRQDRPKIRYRIITADSRARFLDEATISENGVPVKAIAGLFSDLKILTAPLPAVAPGCVIESEVIVEDRQALFPGGRYLSLQLADRADVQHAKVTVAAPKELPLKIANRRSHGEKKYESDPDGISRQIIEIDHIHAPAVRVLLPPDVSTFAGLQISAGVIWAKLASWYGDIVDKLAGPTPAAPGKDPANGFAEIASALAGNLKAVRYTGLELGMASYIPRSPEETLDRGYGDCKDKAVLLVRDLRKAGFRASVALLTPYPRPDIVANLPGAEQFTHAIVYVDGAKPLWIDPSTEFATASHLPFPDQGRRALIVGGGTKDLTTTPEEPVAANTGVEDVEIVLVSEGKGRMTSRVEYRGALNDQLRALCSPDMKQAVQKLAGSLTGSAPKIESAPSSDGLGCKVTTTTDSYPRAVTTGGKANVTVPQIDLSPAPLLPLVAETMLQANSSRTDDYYLSAAFQLDRRTRITPPSGYVAKPLPEFADFPLGSLRIERKAEIAPDGSILLTQRLVCPTRRLTAADGRAIGVILKDQAMKQLAHTEGTIFEFEKKQ
jgi:hypothetical protein